MYNEDFEDWTIDYFENATRLVVSKLRTILRQHGVWVTMNKNTKMSKALYNTIHEEERASWTDIETITMRDVGKPINSDHLRYRIKRYDEGKPLDDQVFKLPTATVQ
jgi:ribosomal protein L10